MWKQCANAFNLSPHASAIFRKNELELRVIDETGSTNTDCKTLIKQGIKFSHPEVLVAYRQVQGRATRGHQWKSVDYALTFSVALTDLHVEPTMSLCVGVAVAKAIHELFNIALQLKWPNDLWYKNAKVGGILSEVIQEPTGKSALVVGIGLNLYVPERIQLEKWPLDGIFSHREDVVKQNWDDAFCHICQEVVQSIQNPRFSFTKEWPYYDAFRDAYLEIELPTGSITGYNRGIDASGRLLLETETTMLGISDGSIVKVL